MYNMLNRVEFLDKLNANTQKRLESGRKTQILSDIDRLKAAAHGVGGEEKRRLEEGIAQLNSDLAKMRGVSTRGVAVGTQAKTPVPTQAKTPTVSVEVQTKGRAKAHKLSPKELKKARVRAKGLAFNPILRRMERVHEDYLPHRTEFYDMSPKPKRKRLKPIDKAALLPHNTLDAFARR